MTALAPPCTAIVSAFGGKRALAADIVQQIGPHNFYYEPFCLSCAVLFAKPICTNEMISDLFGKLTNLAVVLASHRWRELYEAVDRLIPSQGLLESFQQQNDEAWEPAADPASVEESHIERAKALLYVSWCGRNGHTGTKRSNWKIAARWSQGGGSPGIRWRSAVDSVPWWHERLKGVLILRRDAFDLLPKIRDEEGTAIYVDPPYFKSTRGKSEDGAEYVHDFTERQPGDFFIHEDDHDRLAEYLTRFQHARLVLSYYDHPRLPELYPGWTKLAFTTTKRVSAMNRDGGNRSVAPEVLLMNGPVL